MSSVPGAETVYRIVAVIAYVAALLVWFGLVATLTVWLLSCTPTDETACDCPLEYQLHDACEAYCQQEEQRNAD